MFRHRSARALASLGLILSLALTAMAGPAVILGARASAVVTAFPLPETVSPGANVAFDVSFKLAEGETSTLSQLYLSAETPDGAKLLGLEPGSPSQGTCPIVTDALLSCTFGAVSPGVEVTLRPVYETPSSGDSMTVAFNFNTTGVTKGKADKGGNSHGDSYAALPGSVSLLGGGDFAGLYIRDGDTSLQVSDNQSLHNTRNPQSTLVNAPSGAIGVSVGEEAISPSTVLCPPEVGTCFGQWSVISVNDGAPYPDGFSVVVGYKGNIGNANFVHLFDDYDALTNPDAYELILNPEDTCSDSSPEPTELPCMILSSSGGNSYATLWFTENGRTGGY
jgi:hypothetical protein